MKHISTYLKDAKYRPLPERRMSIFDIPSHRSSGAWGSASPVRHDHSHAYPVARPAQRYLIARGEKHSVRIIRTPESFRISPAT